jgi:superfamily II DNA helicase RecQ
MTAFKPSIVHSAQNPTQNPAQNQEQNSNETLNETSYENSNENSNETIAQPSQLALLLKKSFGFETFRQGQEQTISQLLNGHSSLAIFPTGSGKSLCYQLTALHLPHVLSKDILK